MLKRIFSPGTFTGPIIQSVLLSGVPFELRVHDSVALRRAVENIDASPQDLGAFVADVCTKWAALDTSEDTSMQIDSDGPFSIGNRCNTEFSSVSGVENAYFKFFQLCAKKAFEYNFCRYGSLGRIETRESSTVCISRRGGALGIVCAVPYAGCQEDKKVRISYIFIFWVTEFNGC